MSKLWIQAADRRMKAKGTKGAFGKATPKKVAAAKKEGGVEEKRAVFADNMRKIAEHHKHLAKHHTELAKLHGDMGGKE